MAIYCIYYLDHILYPKNPNDALQELPASKRAIRKNCIMVTGKLANINNYKHSNLALLRSAAKGVKQNPHTDSAAINEYCGDQCNLAGCYLDHVERLTHKHWNLNQLKCQKESALFSAGTNRRKKIVTSHIFSCSQLGY